MSKLLLAVPVLVDRNSTLTKCLEHIFEQTSVIDGDTDVYVILNNKEDQTIIDQIDNFDDGFLIENPFNFGVAGSWNQAILEAITHGYKYVACMGYDVMIEEKTFLEKFIKNMDETNMHFADTSGILFNFWMADAKQLKTRVGLYDENFYPGYWEDIDMLIRMSKAEEAGFFNRGRYVQSGEIAHLQSKTINDHEEFIPHDVWNYSYTKNQLYLKNKWNVMDNKAFLETDHPPKETFATPFNNPSLHHSFWLVSQPEVLKSKEKWDKCIENYNNRNKDE